MSACPSSPSPDACGCKLQAQGCDPTCPPVVEPAPVCGPPLPESGRRFADMVSHALAAAQAHQQAGGAVVGIMCEFTPRELIMAAGGLPACLCGGSAAMATAGEEHLPANLCPLIKSTYGYHLHQANPFLEMADLVVAETTCDGKKKMFERMAETRPMHVLELPQKADDDHASEHWRCEVRRLAEVLEQRLGRPLSREALQAAIIRMNRERALRLALAQLMQADEPPLTGRELLDFKSIIAGLDDDLTAYEDLLVQLPQRPSPVAGQRSVRVLLTGVPTAHGAERVIDLIEGHGGLVVCQENCTGVKPMLNGAIDPEAPDLLAAIADYYLSLPCSVLTPNDRRLQALARLAADYRADCIIELVWQACLTYDCEAWRVERLATESLGLPYLRIETDYHDADSARIAVRIEALVETVRGRR